MKKNKILAGLLAVSLFAGMMVPVMAETATRAIPAGTAEVKTATELTTAWEDAEISKISIVGDFTSAVAPITLDGAKRQTPVYIQGNGKKVDSGIDIKNAEVAVTVDGVNLTVGSAAVAAGDAKDTTVIGIFAMNCADVTVKNSTVTMGEFTYNSAKAVGIYGIAGKFIATNNTVKIGGSNKPAYSFGIYADYANPNAENAINTTAISITNNKLADTGIKTLVGIDVYNDTPTGITVSGNAGQTLFNVYLNAGVASDETIKFGTADSTYRASEEAIAKLANAIVASNGSVAIGGEKKDANSNYYEKYTTASTQYINDKKGMIAISSADNWKAMTAQPEGVVETVNVTPEYRPDGIEVSGDEGFDYAAEYKKYLNASFAKNTATLTAKYAAVENLKGESNGGMNKMLIPARDFETYKQANVGVVIPTPKNLTSLKTIDGATVKIDGKAMKPKGGEPGDIFKVDGSNSENSGVDFFTKNLIFYPKFADFNTTDSQWSSAENTKTIDVEWYNGETKIATTPTITIKVNKAKAIALTDVTHPDFKSQMVVGEKISLDVTKLVPTPNTATVTKLPDAEQIITVVTGKGHEIINYNASDKSITAIKAGTDTLKVTVKNGKAPGVPFVKEFPIEVKAADTFKPVTKIEVAAADKKLSINLDGTLDLNKAIKATITPSDASDKKIVWTEKTDSTNKFSISNNILTVAHDATTGSTLELTGTVKNISTPCTINVSFEVEVTSGTVTVKIKDSDGNPMSTPRGALLSADGGKTAAKYKNGTAFGTFVTSSDGTALAGFTKVPYGTYTVVAENAATVGAGTTKMAKTLVVDAATETVDFTFPTYTLKEEIANEPTAVSGALPANPVNSVDAGAGKTFADAVLANTDDTSGGVEVKVAVAASTPAVETNETQAKIAEKFSDEQVPVAVLDIDITKTVKADGALPQDVATTKSPLKFTIKLDASLQDKGPFTVYREHDGTVDKLPTDYDSPTNTITFSSDKFSTFMIVQGTPKTESNPGVPGGPSYSPSYGGGSSSASKDTDAAISANTAKNTEVTVASGITNLSDPTADIKALALNSVEAKAFVDTAASAGFAFAKVYQFNMFSGTTKVTKAEGGLVKVTMPFDGKAGYEYFVLSYSPNGGITAKPTEYKDGKITFTTSDFGQIAIAVRSNNKNLFADTTVKPSKPANGATSVPQTAVCTLGKLF